MLQSSKIAQFIVICTFKKNRYIIECVCQSYNQQYFRESKSPRRYPHNWDDDDCFYGNELTFVGFTEDVDISQLFEPSGTVYLGEELLSYLNLSDGIFSIKWFINITCYKDHSYFFIS